ncbi:MAG: glycosyltransferase family 2 protein [Thermoflexales bacterium]|nr:glycosyltransferase family 2 protein [Thermoflexales bacterium]MCS7323786.1 glycosyltransferase family 2 protein [Thermoflexales bacterium]MCX7939768.1 glycosyltransferase family 2 protein [Thermoflexales bacterium]MDW8053894.1 glycosyltransferase family 2 protein [Anaerolineae bacterium]MDW8292435.1 glycosyltransferase family 2 protein [Anaerolineae bacterium]
MVYFVLPAYNEAKALPMLLERIRRVASRHPQLHIHVIVVDDGSEDDTACAALSVTGLSVRLVRHEHNRGLSEALRSGFHAALEQADDEDAIVTMDADDTHHPGQALRMVALLEEGYDLVIASRYQPGARTLGVPWFRRLLSDGMSALFRLVYPIPGARDYSCGFRAYRAAILRHAFEHYGEAFISERGFTCTVDMLLKLTRLGAVVTEIPMVLRYDRKPSESKMNVRRTVVQTLRLLLRRRLGYFR